MMTVVLILAGLLVWMLFAWVLALLIGGAVRLRDASPEDWERRDER